MHCCCILLISCLMLPAWVSADSREDQQKNVLILNSYHQGYKWTDDQISGIRSVLAPETLPVRVDIQYMDTKRVSDQRYFQQLFEIYQHKYSKTRFDVIVATDNDAFNFLKGFRDRLFPDTPVVFSGVNYFQKKDLDGVGNFTGVNEVADLEGGIRLILRLHPATTKIVFITDTTITGRLVRGHIEEIMPRFRDKVAIKILDNLPMEQIEKAVGELKPGSVVYYTIFARDSEGRFFEFDESVEMLVRQASVPVYGTWDFSLGHGILGGLLLSGSEHGKVAGILALRILRGEKAGAIPVMMHSQNRLMFDYAVLGRFGLSTADLPAGSIIINEPTPFYPIRKQVLWGIIGGMAFLSAVIVILLVNIRQRRSAQSDLRKARDELEIRVQERTADLVRVNDLLRAEIAERTRAENEIRGLNAELGEFNQELETLISERTMNLMALSVADKVRNPAAVIGAVCSRIIDKGGYCDHCSKELMEQVEIMRESSDKLERIVADFQTLLKDKRSIFSYADLNQLVQGIIPVVLREAEARGVKLAISYADNALMINSQQSLLRMSVFHILRNALEATPEGGSVRISTIREADSIMLVVQDTGRGIPKEYLDKIFDPFFSTKERHFGLGLPLVKQVMSEHMGEVKVDSEPGGGTTFRLIFPARWKEKT